MSLVSPLDRRDALPSNLEAEQALLGALICDNAAFSQLEGLDGSHFSEPVHGRIFATAQDLVAKQRLADLISVGDRLALDPALIDLGGKAYLFDLFDKAPPTSTAAGYAAIIQDSATRRALIEASKAIAAAAQGDRDHEATDIALEAERQVTEIARRGFGRGRMRSIGDIATASLERARTRSGRIEFPFGLRDVDAKTGGMNAGEVTILGAWSGMGKTIAGLQVAKANASAGKGTCYFSLEMPEHSMGLRMMCDLAFERQAPVYSGVTSNPTIDAAAKNQLTAPAWERLDKAAAVAARWPLKLDETPGYTVAQIEAIARREHRAWERADIAPGPVIVDHIGKVRPSTNRRGDKTAEMSDVSNELAEMAKRLGVPVVVLSQLNRDADKQGEDKRPQLSHIKQSSTIVEDARQVIFLFRPEYYHREALEHESLSKKEERLEKLREVRHHFYWIVEKNSNGPKGQVLTFCEAACSAVRDW